MITKISKKYNINKKKVSKYNKKSLKKNIRSKTVKNIQKGGAINICNIFATSLAHPSKIKEVTNPQTNPPPAPPPPPPPAPAQTRTIVPPPPPPPALNSGSQRKPSINVSSDHGRRAMLDDIKKPPKLKSAQAKTSSEPPKNNIMAGVGKQIENRRRGLAKPGSKPNKSNQNNESESESEWSVQNTNND